ncbi:response regulator [Deinococcus hohokamensis]|uniref:Response regulator n=1 Tax=Deinococcus hohokamensis TaxID=309883 RepID=A0ABV9I6Q9_9DEIO
MQLAPDITVSLQASSVREPIAQLNTADVDVALWDVRFQDGTGMDVLTGLQKRSNPPAVLMLTTFPDDAVMLRCLHLGAQGFLLKDIGFEELLTTVRFVHAGGRLMAPLQAAQPHPSNNPFALTDREVQTLQLMGSGMNNRELADVLGLSEGTVKNRVSLVLQKLGVRDRMQAVLKDKDLGLI